MRVYTSENNHTREIDMFKLITQIVCAVAIWYGTEQLEWHYLISIALIFVGFVTVHLFWEKYLFNPYDYLGVMYIDPTDPIMMRAEKEATESLEYFLEVLYPKHFDDSMVKFIYRNSNNEIEKLWGDLVSITENKIDIFVRTVPVSPVDDFNREMQIISDDIVDWSIEMQDGSLLGGYSNRAIFKIFEREEGYMHPKFEEHLSRFKEYQSL